MENSIRYKDYIIDRETMEYKAVWDCQVEFTDDCIYYDAEVGIVQRYEDELVFSCRHKLKVTKEDYRKYAAELDTVKQVDVEEILERAEEIE